MAQIAFERDRTSGSGSFRGEGIVWDNANLRNVNVPDRIGEGSELTVTGTLDFDFDPIIGVTFPRDARITVSAGGAEKTQRLGSMGRQESRDWSVTISPDAQPGTTLDVEIVGEGDDVLFGWQTVDQQIRSVEVQTEVAEQFDSALRFAPWAVAGAGGGALLSRSRTGDLDPTLIAAGGGAGAITKLWIDRVGVGFSLPQIPTKQALAGAAVLASGGFLIKQGRSVIPGV